jgi:hypothetical protein
MTMTELKVIKAKVGLPPLPIQTNLPTLDELLTED